jgi:hypothetical protein
VQTQRLESLANGSGAITQNQNAASNGPNVSVDIEQNQSSGFNGSATGANSAMFSQTSSLQAVANTPNGPVTQTQSSPDTDPPFSGLVGTVNQDSRGFSTANAMQTETQCEDVATSGLSTCRPAGEHDFNGTYALHQTQYGPEGIFKASNAPQGPVHLVHKGDGASTQTGNSDDTFTVDQASTQDNTTGSGQTNVVQGDCTTSGNCAITQTTAVDGEQSTNTQSGSDISTSTNCSGSDCTSSTGTITFDGSPGTAPPPATLGPYTMTPFGADPQPACGSSVTGASDAAGTIGFDPALEHLTVFTPESHVQGCFQWVTWSNGYTGDVYATPSQQATITLPQGTQAFYLYAEPDQFGVFTIQATAQDGTTSGPVDVEGNGGAQYFGFYGTRGATLSSITMMTSDTTGFGIGEFGISPAAQVIG